MTFAVAGAGSRGRMFASWVRENIGEGSVVAVAEPSPERRARMATEHGIGDDMQYASWQQMLQSRRLADVLINTTMDRDHADSACAGMRLGYDMLLEKPLAPSLAEAQIIDRVRSETGKVVAVCHSLRHHAIYEKVIEVLRAGTIGDLVSLDQLEAVEHIHQSHSFVRGNWGNESRSTFMLLAKSCHDIDIIAALVAKECKAVSSYGNLTFFGAENAPVGAPEYCVEGCPAEATCPYHALKIYGPEGPWRHHAGFYDLSRDDTKIRLRTSPFGRCVFKTDNDVVDHQVVAMEFEGGVTATFTMTAFTPWGGRYLRIHGTRGYLEAKLDQRQIDIWEFWAGNRHTHIEMPEEDGSHGGADDRLMRNFIEAVRLQDPSRVRTDTAESVRTHTIVFAAEESRRSGKAISIKQFASAAVPA
ncbi:MAG TPA: Gfo/Idh/MocA family oxidoreductase [Fimbriimonas sp.]|nr:Gfo/Idh/MocA family oxidoreductase [Fimbriimonas sp.]